MFEPPSPAIEADTFAELIDALTRRSSLGALAAIALCVALAWALVWALRRRSTEPGVLLGARGFDGALLPLAALVLVLIARSGFRQAHQPITLFQLATKLLASLLLMRVGVRVLLSALPPSPAVRALARALSWAIWLGFALWVSGLLPLFLGTLEGIHLRIGGVDLNLRHLVEGGVNAIIVLMVALWLSSAIEHGLLGATHLSVSARKIAINSARAMLLLVGFLIAMSAAGIPMTALSVLGGAIGVGIGFGLQKLAANYVSGFVILAERSLSIGDVVKIDDFEGRITDIKTRYTVIRAANGREALVPNEMMITQRVENCHFTDPHVALTSVVQVAYGTDLAALFPRLVQAMRAVPRVLASPGPSVLLSNFAADGLELTLVYWIGDIESGSGNVRSAVNLAVLAAIDAAGVEIPYPQRVLRRA